jgi:hypothetical protein
MAGVAGFEPTRCQSQSLVPYRLAIPLLNIYCKRLIMGWITGLEPVASRATIWRSNLLSYTHNSLYGAPEGSRTPGTRIRSPLLYPTELQAHVFGAGGGNRTRAISLEG